MRSRRRYRLYAWCLAGVALAGNIRAPFAIAAPPDPCAAPAAPVAAAGAVPRDPTSSLVEAVQRAKERVQDAEGRSIAALERLAGSGEVALDLKQRFGIAAMEAELRMRQISDGAEDAALPGPESRRVRALRKKESEAYAELRSIEPAIPSNPRFDKALRAAYSLTNEIFQETRATAPPPADVDGVRRANAALKQRGFDFEVPRSANATDVANIDSLLQRWDRATRVSPLPREVYARTPIKADRLADGTWPSLGTFVDKIEGGWGARVANYLRGEMIAGVDLAGFRALNLPEKPTDRPSHPSIHEITPPIDLAAVAATRPTTRAPFSSIGAFQDAYASGSTTPTRVARAFITARNGDRHNAFISSSDADILAQAAAVEARWAAGGTRLPLDGVLVAVKDQIDVKGYPTTLGTAWRRAVATTDAVAIQRLRDQGAIIVGKTNMHEMGGGVTGLNVAFGAVRNAYDTARIGGGSSGGSAVAVARGLVPVAVGSDAGGSIRVPAALNGVMGLKPTWGRVPSSGAAGVFPLSEQLTSAGPMAMNATDLALMYGAMAGGSPLDPSSTAQPPVSLAGFGADPDFRNFNGRGKPLVIGIHPALFRDADPDVVAANQQLLTKMIGAGAVVRNLPGLPGIGESGRAQMILFASDLSKAVATEGKPVSSYGNETRVAVALGRPGSIGDTPLVGLAPSDATQAARVRTRLMNSFDRVFESGVDVIFTPTTGTTAPIIPSDAREGGESDLSGLERINRFTTAANMTGLPALTMNAGYDKNGIPIGAQFTGPAWEEARLLRVARVSEALVEQRAPAGVVPFKK